MFTHLRHFELLSNFKICFRYLEQFNLPVAMFSSTNVHKTVQIDASCSSDSILKTTSLLRLLDKQSTGCLSLLRQRDDCGNREAGGEIRVKMWDK